MLFKRLIPVSDYSSRLDVAYGAINFNELLEKYFLMEPHTILNTAHAHRYFKDYFKNKSAISIGADPLKELSLIHNKLVDEIKVFDIDDEFNEKMNKLWLKNDKNIQYLNCDALTKWDIQPNKYKNLILFQMDYIFNDNEIKKILEQSFNYGIDRCFVISPSIFHFCLPRSLQLNEFVIPAHDFLHSIFYFVNSLKSKFLNKKDKPMMMTYKRSYRRFIGLFNKKRYKVESSNVILNPNGSFHFFVFKKGDN